MYSMPGGSCYTTSENQVLILHAMVQKTVYNKQSGDDSQRILP